jgi:hypothetical protein
MKTIRTLNEELLQRDLCLETWGGKVEKCEMCAYFHSCGRRDAYRDAADQLRILGALRETYVALMGVWCGMEPTVAMKEAEAILDEVGA